MKRNPPGFLRLWILTVYCGIVYLLLKCRGRIKA